MKYKYSFFLLLLISSSNSSKENLVVISETFKDYVENMSRLMRYFDAVEAADVFGEDKKKKFFDLLQNFNEVTKDYDEDIERSIEILNTLNLENFTLNVISINNLTNKDADLNYGIKFCEDAVDHNNKDSVITKYSYFVNFILEGSIRCMKKIEESLKTFGQPANIIFKILFDSFLILQIKAEVLINHSYNRLRLNTHDSKRSNELAVLAFNSYNEFIWKRRNILDIYHSYMEFYKSQEIWNNVIPKCDKEGKTYTEVTKLLQGFIQNEEHLSSKGSCWNTCEEYSYTSQKNFMPMTCENRGCKGHVLNCQWVAKKIQICPSAPHSTRRYDYLVLDDTKKMGSESTCGSSTCFNERYWGDFYVSKCDYCLCICDETDANSDRYISLRPVTSNVDDNMVVTGIRFAKKNRIFHLEIQEGKLSKFGEIIGEKKWKENEYFHITGRRVSNNLDYHTLTNDKRSMELASTTMKLPSNFVVTGVRFHFDKDLIKLKVQMVSYDYLTGRLGEETSWHIPSNQNPSKKIPLDDVDVPLHDRKAKSIPEEALRKRFYGDSYVQFTHTDFNKDVAQTTVPFIELIEVTAEKGPLQGVGLYYKGNKGFGGFIAPTVTAYDYTMPLKAIKNSINKLTPLN